MKEDLENEGWKLFELSTKQKGWCSIVGAKDKYPKTGETLIMFNSGEGNNVQRYPFSMEPGVPLFDFKTAKDGLSTTLLPTYTNFSRANPKSIWKHFICTIPRIRMITP